MKKHAASKNRIGAIVLTAVATLSAQMALAGTCVSDPVKIVGSGNMLESIIQAFSSFAAGMLFFVR